MKIQNHIKKILFLFAAFLISAGFMSCEDNISYPVNRVEIYHNGTQLLTDSITKIPANSPYRLSAVFFNSKNKILEVPAGGLVVWTTDCPTRKFEPAAGRDVSFNSIRDENSNLVFYIKVEYKNLPARKIRFQLQ